MKLARLEEFRQAAYKHLGRAKDATFELTDAILLTRNVYSNVFLPYNEDYPDCPIPEHLYALNIGRIKDFTISV
jgi:hypothetical protein